MDGEQTLSRRTVAVASRQAEQTVRVADRLPGVRAWSAETPNLYTLLLELLDEMDNVAREASKILG